MKARILALAMVCLLGAFWLSGGVSRAAEQPSLQAILTGKAAMPSQPAAEKDEPVAEPDFGFDTPEQAVVAYLTGLKNADLKQMLAACTTGIYARRRDFALLLDRLQAIPSIFTNVPNTNSFLRDANFEIRMADLTKLIVFQYVALLIPELNVDGKTFPFEDEKELDDFLALFGEDRLDVLAGLDILDVVKASEWEGVPKMYRDERNMENMTRQARIYGADDFENIVAAFRVGGRDFLFFPMVCRFDGKWLVTDLMGNVANLLNVSFLSGGLQRIK